MKIAEREEMIREDAAEARIRELEKEIEKYKHH